MAAHILKNNADLLDTMTKLLRSISLVILTASSLAACGREKSNSSITITLPQSTAPLVSESKVNANTNIDPQQWGRGAVKSIDGIECYAILVGGTSDDELTCKDMSLASQPVVVSAKRWHGIFNAGETITLDIVANPGTVISIVAFAAINKSACREVNLVKEPVYSKLSEPMIVGQQTVDLEPANTYNIEVPIKIDKTKIFHSCDGLFGALPSAANTTTTPSFKTIFSVPNVSAGLGGISGADEVCMSKRPATMVSAKALLVDGVNRVACTSQNCKTGGAAEHVDWPFAPKTVYGRGTDVIIGTTDEKGLFDFAALQNSFVSTNSAIWTGFNIAYVSHESRNCSKWTSGSARDYGTYGAGNQTDPTSLFKSYASCAKTDQTILCVEQ